MAHREITLSRTVNATPEKTWLAWTDPAQLAQWWGPNGVTIPTCDIDVRVGGKLYIVMLAGPELGAMAGQKWPMSGEFTDIEENKKLVFSTKALDDKGNTLLEGETRVMFENVADGKTEVTVTTGASGDGPQVEQMLQGMEPGWEQQMDKLVGYLG